MALRRSVVPSRRLTPRLKTKQQKKKGKKKGKRGKMPAWSVTADSSVLLPPFSVAGFRAPPVDFKLFASSFCRSDSRAHHSNKVNSFPASRLFVLSSSGFHPVLWERGWVSWNLIKRKLVDVYGWNSFSLCSFIRRHRSSNLSF